MDERAFWIAFNHVRGIGPARLGALLEECGDIASAWRAPIQTLQSCGLDRRSIENLLSARRRLDPQAALDRVISRGYGVCSWDDREYPANLRQIPQAPPLLYLCGSIEAQDEVAVAVVGTRRVSVYGREVARELGTALARHGVTVVSGLALGVDTIAHRAALEAGGRTVAVLGSGLDQIYPRQNQGLAARISERGALVSEYALGTKPDASNFPPRNRIISGLSRAVVVVEAGKRSGALITASFGAEQSRDVFAVPGSILNAGSDGCNRLIQDGAVPVTSIPDFLERLDLDTAAAHQEARATVPATPDEELILSHISSEPQHMNDIVREAPMDTSQVSSLLTMMELKGLVRQVGALLYVRGT